MIDNQGDEEGARVGEKVHVNGLEEKGKEGPVGKSR